MRAFEKRFFVLCIGLCVQILLLSEVINADDVEPDQSSNEITDQAEPSLPTDDDGEGNTSSRNVEPKKSPVTDNRGHNTDVVILNDEGKEADPELLGEIFDDGVEAYLNEDWNKCIDDFERGIKSYKKYKKAVADCRVKCRAEAESVKPIFPYDIEDLQFYERKIRESLCLMKCKIVAKMLRNKKRDKLISTDVELKYVERKPYEYLHICYYQMKRYQHAANAVFTYLTMHKEHDQSLKNLQFYVGLPDVVDADIVDLESDPFLAMYRAGITAYNDENHLEVIHQLENSIEAYIKAENDCRLYCEGPFDQGWYPDYTMSISNHFVYVLKCKQGCSTMLSNINGEQHYDLLADHYHYLQFAYSKVGKLRDACAAVESFLTFLPSDETVLRNKKYLMELPEVKREYFEPRKEALTYLKRREYEKRIFHYIQNHFKSSANSTI